MKKIIVFFLFLPLALLAQKIDKEYMFNYSDGIVFSVQRIQKYRTITRGSKEIIAGKGRRFISITFEFINKTPEEQIIDFEKFTLEAKDKQIHKVDYAVIVLKLTETYMNLQLKIKPYSKRGFIVMFRPSFAKDELVEKLIIDGNVFMLRYK